MRTKHVPEILLLITLFAFVYAFIAGCGQTPGEVTGQVTDASSGTALYGANVFSGGQIATTDVYGNYTIRNVPAGTMTVVVVFPPSYDDNSAPILVSAGETVTQNLTLSQLTASANIAGQVIDASSGLSIDGAIVSVEGQGTTTKEGGNFTLQGVPSGDQTIMVRRAGYDDLSETITITDGEMVTKNFILYANPANY